MKDKKIRMKVQLPAHLVIQSAARAPSETVGFVFARMFVVGFFLVVVLAATSFFAIYGVV